MINEAEYLDESPAWYWATVLAIVFTVAFVIFSTRPSGFADFDVYVYYLSSLVHMPPENWWYFELFSNILFLFLYWLVPLVEPAVRLGHNLMAFAFVALLVQASPQKTTSWKSLVLVFALVGPLLAFVTLRATPAYFMAIIAMNHAVRGEKKAWIYFAVSFLFHASAILALIPVLMVFFKDRFPKFLHFEKKKPIIVCGVILALGSVVFAGALRDGLSVALESIPGFAKYMAYSRQDTGIENETSITHYVYFAVISLATVVFIAFSGRAARNVVPYVVLSYVIYLVLFVVASPVASFRQSPYWVIPMILAYPWSRIGVYGIAAPAFFLGCAGFTYFGISSVYAPWS